MTWLNQRTNIDAQKLTDEQVTELRRAGVKYAAAVSIYNDVDTDIARTARNYATSPWEVYDLETQEQAFALMEQREQAIANLARAKRAFLDIYKTAFGKEPWA